MDFSFFRKTLSDFTDANRRISKEIEAKKVEVEALKAAPAALEDVDKFIDNIFRMESEKYTTLFQKSFFNIMPDPIKIDQPVEQNHSLLNGSRLIAVGFQPNPVDMERALMALFREPLSKALKEQYRKAVRGKEPGLPIKQRLAKIARLESEIKELEEAKEQFLAEAEAAGVKL